MEYDFDTVKRLYDNYDIAVDSITKKHYIISVKDGKHYSFQGPGAEKVKFAHFWVYAANYGRSVSEIKDDTNESDVNDKGYELAFSDALREVYNSIIGTEIRNIQETGQMSKAEELKIDLSDVHYAHPGYVVDGLYSNPNGYASFENWCKEVSKEYSYTEWRVINRGR